MAQHFLLSAQARDLSLMKLFNMSEDEAFENYKAVRWYDSDDEPVCPACGNTNNILY